MSSAEILHGLPPLLLLLLLPALLLAPGTAFPLPLLPGMPPPLLLLPFTPPPPLLLSVRCSAWARAFRRASLVFHSWNAAPLATRSGCRLCAVTPAKNGNSRAAFAVRRRLGSKLSKCTVKLRAWRLHTAKRSA